MIGICTDKAGNVGTMALHLKYDATPPALRLAAAPGDGTVALSLDGLRTWLRSALSGSRGAPVLHGARPSTCCIAASVRIFHDGRVSNGVSVPLHGHGARDQAGNVTVRTLVVTPGPRLLSPADGARVTAPPVLTWTPIRDASYYNVQLYRGAARC